MKAVNLVLAVMAASGVAFAGFTAVSYFRSIDRLPPVISMESPEVTVSIDDPLSQTLDGVSAVDDRDMDVTDNIVVSDVSDFVAKNSRRVRFTAFDSNGNYSEASRMMVYSDYEPVTLSIDRVLRFPTGVSDADVLGAFSAWDCLDGDISSLITFTEGSVISSMSPGRYHVGVTVSNSAGDSATLPVTVEIYNPLLESAFPEIRLTQYMVHTPLGEKVNPKDFLKDVRYRGKDYGITEEEGTFGVDTSDWDRYEKKLFDQRPPAVNIDRFDITSYVNAQVPGVYDVVYDLSDSDGNTGSVILTVVVDEDE